MNADRRRTIDEISEITGLSWSSCQRMLTEDLNMKRVSAKFVPRLLTQDQNNNRLNVYYDLKEQAGNDPQILSKVVTGDEIWCYGFADVSEAKKKTLEFLNSISTEELQKCFQQWEKRWHRCIESKGDYFEGD